MPTFRTLIHRTSVTLLTLGFLGALTALGGFVDDPPDTAALSAQISALSGTGLMLTECQEHMQKLGTLLGKAGYGPMRSHLGGDGVMTARWYHPQRHTTVLAFAGWQASGNAFSAAEMAGLMRWNELSAAQ